MNLADLAAIPMPCPVALTFLKDTDLNPDAQAETEGAELLRVTELQHADSAHVHFRSPARDGRPAYEWTAYIYDGRLSYGSSAEELWINGLRVTA